VGVGREKAWRKTVTATHGAAYASFALARGKEWDCSGTIVLRCHRRGDAVPIDLLRRAPCSRTAGIAPGVVKLQLDIRGFGRPGPNVSSRHGGSGCCRVGMGSG
jgi:hypothetical protein